MAQDHMDVRRPKQKVKRNIKRSNIALDDYMFERKMQSLYYGAKPKSDDTPGLIKAVKRTYHRTKKEVKSAPATLTSTSAKIKVSALKYPVRFLIGSLALCVIALFAAVTVGHNRATTKTPASQPADSKGLAGAAAPTSRIPLNQTPEFPVVLPQGKTAEDLGGWAKVNPPNAPSTYAFKDKIGAVNILVSEQMLPDAFKTDTSGQVEKLAVGFNANQSVKTEKSEFFVGSNSDGEQSVITYTKTLLIFLKSSAKVSNERWQTYIEDLR